MAGIKISALPAIAAPAAGDVSPTVQTGVTYKVSNSQLATFFNSNLTFVPLAGGTISGPILYASAPVGSTELVNKAYVDTIAQGITVQGAVRLGTTGALTVTYSNGASGVGATLTNAGAQAALTIDGVAAVVNDRILVKNQASALQNGIYTVTDIGSGATNWVMTRALDYDQPAEIQAGDLVVINLGTTNTGSSWLQTATVVTVGVSAINFSQFSASLPISLANGGTGASLTASNGGIFYSNASAGAILAGTATAGQILRSGSSSAPSWSTSTFADTYTASNLLYSNGANTVTGLATANNGVLVTSAGGVPSISSTLPAFTTSSITFNPSTSGIIGTTTNNNASAGFVGEFISNVRPEASALPLTTAVAADVTSISITAGDWDVWGNAFIGFAATDGVDANVWISTTSATIPERSLRNELNVAAIGVVGMNAPYVRISTASTITVYLSVYAAFTVGSAVSGGIYARRAR